MVLCKILVSGILGPGNDAWRRARVRTACQIYLGQITKALAALCDHLLQMPTARLRSSQLYLGLDQAQSTRARLCWSTRPARAAAGDSECCDFAFPTRDARPETQSPCCRTSQLSEAAGLATAQRGRWHVLTLGTGQLPWPTPRGLRGRSKV